MLCPPRSLEVCSPRFPPIPVATPEPPRSRSSPSASSSFRRCGRQLRPRSRPQERRRWTARGQKGVNLAAAFADELTHILGGVAGGMEIIAQRMRIAHGAFDIHAWARVIPLLSNATIQAGIIGPDGWLVSTTLAPAPEPIDLWEFLSPRAREGQCLPAWVRRAAHWQGRAASADCKKSEWLRRRGLSLLIPGDATGFSVVCYKSTPGCFEHIACRFPAIARHANPVLHIRPCNPRRNPWLPTNQSICSRARGDNTRGGPRCGAWGRARADFGRTRGTAGVRPLPWKSAR